MGSIETKIYITAHLWRNRMNRQEMDLLNDEMLQNDNEVGGRRESVNLPFYLETTKNGQSMVLDAHEEKNRLGKWLVDIHDLAFAHQ